MYIPTYISYHQYLTAYLKLPHIGLKIRNSSSSVGSERRKSCALACADAILSTIGPVARWLLLLIPPSHRAPQS